MAAATSADSSMYTMAFTDTAVPPSNTQNTNDLSDGAKAGIGLGVSFGILLLLGVIAGVYLASRRRGRATRSDPALIQYAADGPQFSRAPSYELIEQRRTSKTPAQQEPAEIMSLYR
ncbi:hypothetical protein F5Y13DRAFT_29121 [Hypoxylon sp. FL1857]|nr:hypothetical protein F5Y13DRAFT_29121 [Hypoxylon sp. FL1857]